MPFKNWLLILFGFMLLGCGQSDQNNSIPANAIKIDDALFMIPLDEKVEDCKAYRSFSPDGFTVEVIFYEQVDGSFAPTREGAKCE